MKYFKQLMMGACILLAGCASTAVQDYADNKPTLDIRSYLNGDLEAWGVFIDRSGKADPRFHVTMKGSWNGDVGTLQEHFDYSDGRKQERIWTFRFTDEHHFTGTAADVMGEALGAQYGNAVNMNYVLALDTKKGTYHVSMDDWLYLMDDKTLINRTQMTKYGFTAGELIITFRKK